MKKNVQRYIAVFLLMLTASFVLAAPASAQLKRTFEEGEIQKQLKPSEESFFVGQEGEDEKTIFILIGTGVEVVFSFVGVLLLVLIIYASFLWLTAGGNTDQVKKAKNYIRNAVIGLIIVLTAVILSQFIFGQLDRSFGGAPPAAPSGP